MDSFWIVVLAAAASILLWAIWRSSRAHSDRLPPGPFRWPIVGCLPSYRFHHRHRAFYELSKRFGPIMSIPIGSSNIFVVHGKDLAMEVLKIKDSQFCSRPLIMTGKYIGFDHSDPGLSPLNDNWRIVRKATSNELMAPFRLSSQAPLRREEVLKMVNSLLEQGLGWFPVNVRKVSEGVVGGILCRMLFGDHYSRKTSGFMSEAAAEIAREFKQNFDQYLTEGNVLWGALNLADYFPVLACLDVQGLEARFQKLMSKVEPLFRMIIQEHRELSSSVEDVKKDVIDVLLQNNLSDKQIMGILSDALLPGISTTAAAIEWAMAELVANPHTLIKAQEELDKVIGKSSLMNESHIPELPYLQGIAKEVFRLHPPAPLNDPHLNEEESSLGGYKIPPKSTTVINLWGLGQDPNLWENPTEFAPERFLHSDLNVHGTHFELIPFSSGRRRCPAHALATLKLQHVLGALLHGFEWRSEGAMDLEEGDGIVVAPKTPLLLCARPRVESIAYSS